MSDLEVAAKVITDLQAQIKGLKGQLNLYRWGMVVVSHGLSKKYSDQSGHIAQNVNFAIKSYLVEGLLSSNHVSFEKSESAEKLELPDIAEKAETFTVLVGCWE